MKRAGSTLTSKPLAFAVVVAMAGCSERKAPQRADDGESAAPLAAFDVDGNGKISGDEAPLDILRGWKQFDANADGFIDKDEQQNLPRKADGVSRQAGQRENSQDSAAQQQVSVSNRTYGERQHSRPDAREDLQKDSDVLDRTSQGFAANVIRRSYRSAGGSPSRPDNILLLIVDDWGIDSSPIDNTAPPAAFLPNMPNLQALAEGGLRFANAYAQPTCSPTRATLLTGRHPHQTTAYRPILRHQFRQPHSTRPPGNPNNPRSPGMNPPGGTRPGGAAKPPGAPGAARPPGGPGAAKPPGGPGAAKPPGAPGAAKPPGAPGAARRPSGGPPGAMTGRIDQFSADETTLPDAFAAANSPYALAAVGKWHLGGGPTGYRDIGGWPEFYGIDGATVLDYFSWTKNTNGTVATSTTYTTTDQVNEAVAFIDRSESAGAPWFCWVAFNVPHSPFHVPPAELAPPGGYSTPATGNHDLDTYILMLEAFDTELGRLMAAVDQSVTNIILVGDNGPVKEVVQTSAGDGHYKGGLYETGVHVPMVVNGPAVTVPAGGTTDRFVHVIDLFSTILELAGIDPSIVAPADAVAQSKSIVPILSGTDTTYRYIVSENNHGRTIRVEDFPEYKLIINGDPLNPTDFPNFEFYNIGAPAHDVNEQSPLNIPGLTGTALNAFHACLILDAAIGGGYNAP